MIGRSQLPSGNAGLPDVSYYDFALAVLPIPLFVGLFVGEYLSVSPRLGVSAGAMLSAIAVGYLLFRDPPTRRGPRGGFNGPSA